MYRTLAAFVLLLAWPISARAGAPASDAADFFETKVRPLLDAQCLRCHGPEKQKAGLRLDSREAALKGGDSGPAMKPGDPEASRIVEAIRYDGDVRMPPKRKLEPAEIAVLTDWIKAGAPWPEPREPPRPAATTDSGFTVSAEDRAFWSFQPIADPPLPSVRNASWVRSDIDRFVLARLESEGLQPVSPADKRTLIRRASFDLVGLPPTPEEIEAFEQDRSPEAFARVVDRLLASPRYGERWARHWLDVARYGEDQAHTFEARLFPFGYRYRDWVARAFNEDMPYDQFLIEQVAGDLIEGPQRDDRLAATGFFALGPHYYGGAVYDELDDRVDTLTRGVLGLTVACARCHDHKFDPIGQKDYYALAGIFKSTEYKEYPAGPAEIVARYDRAQEAIKAQTGEVAAYLRTEAKRWSEHAAESQTARYVIAAWTLSNRRKSDPNLKTTDVATARDLEPALLDRWVAYLFKPEVVSERPYLARWKALLERQDRQADLSCEESSWIEVAQFAEDLETYVRACMHLRQADQEHAAAANALAAGKEPLRSSRPDGPEAVLARDMLEGNGLFALPRDRVESNLPDPAKAELKALRTQLDRLKKEAPAKYPVTHALADARTPGNMRVFLRGNPATPGDEAPRRFLAVLSEQDAPGFSQGSGRLELARAIASAENPLTARVLVNRVWAIHFGRGLVGTPSNLGRLGERPTHPELLDFLAHRFIAAGWSIKRLHREILLSAVYQRSSTPEATAQERDPANLLLWRANRRRLEVEAWRDAMLAVSGELDGRLGGAAADLKSPDMRRRTLYGAVSRHNLDGLLRLFDFPDPNLTSDRRSVTTVPLQQLFVLNSPFMQARGRALAARLTADPQEADHARVRRAFSLLFGRPASEDEVQMGVEYLRHDEEKTKLTRWEQYAQVLLGTNEFLFVD
jgi:cytochrome c553